MKLILNKWLRYSPSLIGLLCFELIWPLLANGPLVDQIIDYNTRKVEQYWWSVPTFTSNILLHPIETPVLHTNFSMIDFQLFLIGLVIIYFLQKNVRTAIKLCILVSVASYASFNYYIYKYDVPPHWCDPHFTLRRVLKNLTFVHFNLHTYVPYYCSGILTAYFVHIKNIHYPCVSIKRYMMFW